MPMSTPIPAGMVKVEYPPEMKSGDSYIIKLSLTSVKGGIYTPTVEIRYTAEVEAATPKPVGTPGVPLEKQFGEQYDIESAIARITAVGFECQLHDPESQPIDREVSWRWGIKPKVSEKPEPGKREIILSLSLRWQPKLPEFSEIESEDIWSDTLWVSVQEPLFTRGQINILGTLGSFVGPALTIPWLYERWKERRATIRKDKERKRRRGRRGRKRFQRLLEG